jgi:Protein of unknown function (DUF3248)
MSDDLNRQLGLEEELESPEPLPTEAFEFEMDGMTLAPKVAAVVLEGLSNQLVWKIGKEEGSERVVVRVGYASATPSFRELPRLRSATDTEMAEAARNGDLVVEWIE